MITYKDGRNQPKRKSLGYVCVMFVMFVMVMFILSSEIFKIVRITWPTKYMTYHKQKTVSIPASYY